MLASLPEVAEAIRRLLRRGRCRWSAPTRGPASIPRDLLPCFAGRVGLSHNQPGDQLLDAADLVVTVGFDPIEYDPVIWNRGKTRPIVHIDTHPGRDGRGLLADRSSWSATSRPPSPPSPPG